LAPRSTNGSRIFRLRRPAGGPIPGRRAPGRHAAAAQPFRALHVHAVRSRTSIVSRRSAGRVLDEAGLEQDGLHGRVPATRSRAARQDSNVLRAKSGRSLWRWIPAVFSMIHVGLDAVGDVGDPEAGPREPPRMSGPAGASSTPAVSGGPLARNRWTSAGKSSWNSCSPVACKALDLAELALEAGVHDRLGSPGVIRRTSPRASHPAGRTRRGRRRST